MAGLPEKERVLMGPGPSPVSPRVMRAMAAPVVSHLDPLMVALLDDLRAQVASVIGAPAGAFSFAVSGTGTAGMEAAVANLVGEGTRALVVVTGYFGERLVQMCQRYGAQVSRVDVEWGRAVDPDAVRRALQAGGIDVVAVVQAETSTGVLNPVAEVAALAREFGALTIVDTVTSLGAHPVDMAAWDADAVYSCSQKGLGAPSGLAPLSVSPRARRRHAARSFYLDLDLIEQFWVGRKYHHTISAPLVYALHEALAIVIEEGLEARWARHERHHRALAAGLAAMELGLLPPPGERLWTLNAVVVPKGVNEADVRRHLLERFDIEIGAGLGPLAGRIWRVGLMGAGSTPEHVRLVLTALEEALRAQGVRVAPGAGAAAADRFLAAVA